MIFVTRVEHFSSSHVLRNPNLSEEKNLEVFGKCNNFHGHNYYLEVTLKGEPDPESGYVFDLKELKTIIEENILKIVDHNFLNDLEIFNNLVPTTENMAVVFWNILKEKVRRNNAGLYSIRIYETAKNIVEYKG